MKPELKRWILDLREKGYGYNKIAETTGINESTIKSFLRRTAIAFMEKEKLDNHLCLNCGTYVEQNAGRKIKKFCSDKCRNQWWNSHPDRIKRKHANTFVCSFCGKSFKAYGVKRKYCSRKCYFNAKFGSNRHDKG